MFNFLSGSWIAFLVLFQFFEIVFENCVRLSVFVRQALVFNTQDNLTGQFVKYAAIYMLLLLSEIPQSKEDCPTT